MTEIFKPGPISQEDIDSAVMKEEYIGVSVEVDFDEVIGGSFEDFLDLISERAGVICLMDISYNIVGFEEPNTLIFNVSGDASEAATSQVDD
jgi:hypothetical protein